MNVTGAIAALRKAQHDSGKPLAIVLAGHNGSGKSTFWYRSLAPRMQMPLVNADPRRSGRARSAREEAASRFPRTQKAVGFALDVVDAALLVDNSRSVKKAFTVCRVEVAQKAIYDLRTNSGVPAELSAWLDIVRPT